MNFTEMAAKNMMEKGTNKDTIKVGDTVKALTSNGAFATCFEPETFKVAKVNRKTFKTECGKTIQLINLR